MNSDLDSLWAESRRALREAEERKPKLAPTPKASVRETYTLPENWLPGRILALIHEESHSLIGNYQEFSHRTEKGARKLVRLEGPAVPTGTEIVRGWEHLGAETKGHLIEAQVWEVEREVVIDLPLALLGVHASGVPLKVCLRFGAIVRAELKDHTTFSSLDGQMVITLPRGTNVLEVLSLEGKLALREELK